MVKAKGGKQCQTKESEICLNRSLTSCSRPVATEERGKIHTVFTEQVVRHSQKPEISYEIIERLYPDCRKLELYARRERDGWDSWGNEL